MSLLLHHHLFQFNTTTPFSSNWNNIRNTNTNNQLILLTMIYINPHQIVKMHKNEKKNTIVLYFTDRRKQKLNFLSTEHMEKFLNSKKYFDGIEWMFYEEIN